MKKNLAIFNTASRPQLTHMMGLKKPVLTENCTNFLLPNKAKNKNHIIVKTYRIIMLHSIVMTFATICINFLANRHIIIV